MKCHNCGKTVEHDDNFCLHCGEKLTVSHKADTESRTIRTAEVHTAQLPADQAEQIISNTKLVISRLSQQEKIIGGCALAALLAFFMPWTTAGYMQTGSGYSMANSYNWFILLPVAAILSLALLYFGQGAKKEMKIFHTTIHSVAGVYIAAAGLSNNTFGAQFGLWLMILAGIVLAATALYYQQKVLLKG